jgi:hypothetical protein
MTYNQDNDYDLPPARKGSSGEPPGGGLNPGSDPWSAPVPPTHDPDFSYGYGQPSVPNSDAWFGQPSTPYGAPIPGITPPPPPNRVRRTATGGQNNRRRNIAIIFPVLLVLLAGSAAGYIFLKNNGPSQGGSNPVALATNTPTPTPTLLPGQTPLPTRVPTPTPVPTIPGQPAPTATSIPYASHATVTFTAASKSISSAKPTLMASTSGGDISASTANANVNVGDTSTAAIDAPQTSTGSQIQFTINVKNIATTTRSAPVGILVTSNTDDGTGTGTKVSCTIITSGTIDPVTPNNSTQQQCIEPQQFEPAATYNITINNWTYTTSGSTPAGGSAPVWTVPTTCASANIGAAHTAAQSKLSTDLSGSTPGGSTVFYKNYSFNDAGATCTPAAGTAQNSPFTFTVSVAGTGNETYYSNSAVQSFEAQQLQSAANAAAPVGSWQLISSHNSICSGGGGSTSGASATSVTITCAASGVAGWIWSSSSAASIISPIIVGESKSAATSTVNAVQGVKSGSVSISLTGGTYLPLSTSAIGYTIKTP